MTREKIRVSICAVVGRIRRLPRSAGRGAIPLSLFLRGGRCFAPLWGDRAGLPPGGLGSWPLGWLSYRDGGCAVVLLVPFSRFLMMSSKSTDMNGRASRISGGLAITRHLFLRPGGRGGEKKENLKELAKLLEVGLGLEESGDHYIDTVQVRGVAMGGPVPPQEELNWDFF